MRLAPRPGEEQWITEHARHWVDLGIISGEQAEEILRREHAPAIDAGATTEPEGRRGLPLLAEALSYLGILLVTSSGAFVVVHFWHRLGTAGRIGVGLVVTAVGFGAAAIVNRNADAGSVRVAAFLRLCATGGVAIVAGVTADALGSKDAATTALVVGLAAFAANLLLWRNRDRPLAFLGALAGLVVSAVALVAVVGVEPTPSESGAGVMVASLALAACGFFGVIHPSRLAAVLGEAGALTGALVIAGDHPGAGAPIGLLLAIGGLVLGLVTAQRAVVGVALVGFLVFLFEALSLFVHGAASAFAVLVVGIVLVVVALQTSSRGRRPPRDRTGKPGGAASQR